MSSIRVEHIAFDAGTQIRAAINEQVVTDYADRMTDGVQFPPIVVFTDGTCREDRSPIYYLADGFHRTQAALRNQFRDIPADVRQGTKDDALWFALGANRENGHRLTDADKSHAIALALKQWPEKLHREIADQVGCSKSLVTKVISLDTGELSGIRGHALRVQRKREEVRRMVQAGETSIAIKEKLGAHTSMIAEVREELGKPRQDKSRTAVSQRRKDIREMADRGFTSRQIAAAVGLDDRTVAGIVKAEGIVVHADRVVGKTHRHDSNRIVAQIVADAENLTEGVELVDFAELTRSEIAGWLKSLQDSREKLGGFIRRLIKEHQHGEAA